MYHEVIRSALGDKCAAKTVLVPTAAHSEDSPLFAELRSGWANMLGHQLPTAPSLAPFLEELPVLFAWLKGEFEEVAANVIGYRSDENETWSPPPTAPSWRMGVPLKTIRF